MHSSFRYPIQFTAIHSDDKFFAGIFRLVAGNDKLASANIKIQYTIIHSYHTTNQLVTLLSHHHCQPFTVHGVEHIILRVDYLVLSTGIYWSQQTNVATAGHG